MFSLEYVQPLQQDTGEKLAILRSFPSTFTQGSFQGGSLITLVTKTRALRNAITPRSNFSYF